MNKLRIVFFSLICLTSCIGEDFIEVDSSQNERLRIVPQSSGNSDLLNLGDSLVYTAEFTNAMGQIEAIPLTWSSSREEIATIDENGKVMALKAGAVSISVSATGKANGEVLEDSRLLVIEQIERVEISSDVTSFLIGDSIILTARYYNPDGVLEAASFDWSSSDISIATIDQAGKLKALAIGSSEITASANGINSRPLSIAVVEDSLTPAAILIESDTNEISQNDTLRFRATVTNINGVELAEEVVTWNSSDLGVLTVDQTGFATAVGVGSSEVTATAGNVVSNTINVLVSQATVTSRSGSFQNENGYRVSGDVELRQTANNDLELRFSSNFSSQAGPDLAIYLGNNTSSGIEIASLNQLSGSFTVAVPSTIEINDYDFVLIWCKAVNAAFGSARLN